jgi:hypothetical protein
MRVERRQMILGAATVAVLGLAAWTFWPAAPASSGVTPSRARGSRAAAPMAPSAVEPVKLDALRASRDGPGEAARNPFRFQPKVVPPPPRSAPMPVTEAPPRPVVTAPVGPPPPPPIALKFIASVTRADGTRWAALSDGKSAPMYGKEGDIIDGRYLIVKIGTESIEMTYTDGRGRQVIRLTGQ